MAVSPVFKVGVKIMDPAKVGDTVELNDKESGFTDAETGFDISRDQRVKLTEPIGQKTNVAVLSGCLLVVAAKKTKADEAEGAE